jgi:predicted nucleic acid-binding protein
MRIAVKDASILIDLSEGDLLGLWFQLKIETHTTDFVLGEVRKESQWQYVSAFVDAGLIQKHATAANDLAGVVEYSQANGISMADASGVLLAMRLKACLLTGDGRMRRTARTEKVEVRGVLWIMDQLVERGVLPKAEAEERLEKICAAGSRLPREECATRIKAWRGKV